MSTKMKTTNPVGLVLPAYNEASVITKVLGEIPTSISVDNQRYSVLVVVVNDASTDNTISLVKKHKGVKLINHLLNSGAGASTRTGINYASQIGCSYIATMDSDGQHTSKDAVKVLAQVIKDKADLVIGSRLIETDGMPWYRIAGNKFLSLFTFILFGVFVADTQSGLKAMNKRAADKIVFHSNAFAFSSEMIWKAHKAKLRIQEVPIQAIYTDYSLAKGQKNWDSIHIISQLIKRRVVEFFNG